MEWVKFTADFDYVKDFYEVLLPTGEIVPLCWPNAGLMNTSDGTNRRWSPDDNISVRPDVKNLIGGLD